MLACMGYKFQRVLLGCFLFVGPNFARSQQAEPPVHPAPGPESERVAAPQKVTVTLLADANAPEVASRFLGVSYESKELLPRNGKYYFNAGNSNLVRMYHTLGIKSLRVGANAVDEPQIPVPDTKDIEALFKFARAVDAKVIYSFRLKNGDPANAARLAAYITKKYSAELDSFCVGNESNFYLKPYKAFDDAFRPEYQAILSAVPGAIFDGPASAGGNYPLKFANEFFPGGHISIVSAHAYPLGNGRDAEKNPAEARERFVSNRTERNYQKMYDEIVLPLAEKNIPFRMDETNSCHHGGARDCSDAYASTLWGLDYLNWWAAHHIVGLNFHTGDQVSGLPDRRANYAAFVSLPDSSEFEVHPLSYAMLAFSQIAHGRPMDVQANAPAQMNFNAYAYQDGSNIYVAAANKSHGNAGETGIVTFQLPVDIEKGKWYRMDLEQKDSDIAAKTGVSLGGSDISPRGKWHGKWEKLKDDEPNLTVTINPATEVLLWFTSEK